MTLTGRDELKVVSAGVFIAVALVLAGCSTGRPAFDHWRLSTSDPIRLALPDESAQVEAVFGLDPKRFYIANQPALNAVDLDSDGVWDDLWARISKDDRARAVLRNRPEGLKQHLMSYQDMTLSKTKAEVRLAANRLLKSMSCLSDTAEAIGGASGQGDQVYDETRSAVKESFLTSKERVMAYEYGNALLSGFVSDSLPAPGEGCK